ncbi:HDOD domain-containing protein [Desulfoplanes formicivorans]|uniref:histidine kinase n=1 Tax=Desulfoplanes formicivorans TaxID=1592317 RepID=A0A194AC12_9BACT|nr:HDOD domain-containing protein [Desulfoplanes formicivorans]GAU07687.1 histidine kinase [Desulfoplanes formicivorans]
MSMPPSSAAIQSQSSPHADHAPITPMSMQIDSVLHFVDQMPSLPAVAAKILRIVLEEEFSLGELATLVESDPALTLKVLKSVNSADRGGHPISSVAHAFPLIGMRPLRILLLSVIVRDGLVGSDADEDGLYKDLWVHSLASALFAGLLAKRTYPQLCNEAFAAAMLHDIGKIFFLVYFPEKFAQCRERIRMHREPSSVAEEKLFKTNHAAIGRALAKKWHLPDMIENAIWQHHLDPEVVSDHNGLRELLFLVKSADYLAHEALVDAPCPSMTREEENGRILDDLGIGPDDLASIKTEFTREFEEHVSLFDLDGDGATLFYQALQRANERLASIALELDRKNVSLSISNRFATTIVKAGIAFNSLDAISDFFPVVPQFLDADLGIERGVLYWVNESRTFLEGIVWKSGGFKRLFSCSLGKDMEPIQEPGGCSISAGLVRLIKTSREREQNYGHTRETSVSPPFSVSQGLTIFPLFGKVFFGELCLGMAHKEHHLTAQDFLGFSQFVALIVTTLDRLRVYRDLCRRADELSAALWKNHQVNLQLMQTERLAAVGQLAAGAAHEINNPLAIISARTQMIEAKEKDDKKKQELRQIHEQIDRISSILTSLMGFARPAPPSKSQVDVNALLDKVLDLVSPPMLKLNIRIERNYADNLPSIHADAGQLEQVFLNFCINAQHAMEEHGGTLTVTTSPGSLPNWVDIVVQDTGIGIAKECLAKVFDPFFTTKEQGKGTGLGLSTAYGIVTNHYGNVGIKSEPGQGTRVCVSLPVMSPREDRQKSRLHSRETTDEGSRSSLKRPRILVVDDEEHIRDILTETLTAHGCTVDVAENGRHGFEKLTRHAYDLMLMDIRMPSYSGLDLLARIRNQIHKMPVFVITGLASSEEMDKALELGAAKCIRKPFHIKSLIQDIRSVVSLS